jgi:hypothetical protein
MAAIITETFRRKMRDLLDSDMQTTPYYIGIGKSNPWEPNSSGSIESSTTFSVPIPKGTPADDLEVLHNLTSLIKIKPGDISAAIPRVAWKSGNKYKAYNPYDETCFYSDSDEALPCYVINESATNKPIYLCIRAGKDVNGNLAPSTVAPTLSTYGAQTNTADGYTWVYIQDYINLDETVNSSSFTQIHKQNLVQRGAEPSTITLCRNNFGGKIYGFTIVNGGSGYSITSPPSLFISIRRRNSANTADETVYTLDTSFQLIPTVTNPTVNGVTTNGVITDLTFGSQQTIAALLSDSNNSRIISASIQIVNGGGSGALIVPHISPYDGFGYQPSKDFPGWYMGLYSKLEDNTDDTFFTPYRQISVVRNPSWDSFLGQSPPNTLRALRYFVIDQDINSLPADISGLPIRLVQSGLSITPIIGYADLVSIDLDPNKKRLYFHQCYSSGFGYIPSTGYILVGNVTEQLEYELNSGEYTHSTGEVVFTENRKPIVRTPQQAEELKIIIQL